MKPLTINLLKQYRRNVLVELAFVAIESFFLYELRDQFTNLNFVKFLIIMQLATVAFSMMYLTRFQILDENGITVKRMLATMTFGWDRVSEYGIYDSTRGLKKKTLIRVMFDGSVSSVELDYSEEAMTWLHHRCGAPSYDKRKKPSP